MEKATVNLSNWQIYVYDGRYNLSGQCDYHPVLGKNSYVSRTTSLVRYDFDAEEKILFYETRNTLYSCPLKYLLPYPYRDVVAEYKMKLANLYEDEASIIDKIISVMAIISIRQDIEGGWRKDSYEKYKSGKKNKFMEEIESLISQGQEELKEKEQLRYGQLIAEAKKYEDCVYIEIAQLERGDLLAYHIGARTGILKPHYHSSMFQDSIYYVEYDVDKEYEYVDFRYFPRGFGLADTYRWSKNIKQAVLKNDSDRVICFNDVKIPIGETVIIKPKTRGISDGGRINENRPER